MEIEILNDILIIFIIAIAVIFISNRLHIPTIVGFLLTGIVAGPYGLSLIKGIHEVEILAEIGVLFLLFTIGIEFSLKHLIQIRKSVLLGGSLQVVLTILVTFFVAKEFGLTVETAIFWGFLVSLSSTAIVLKVFQERGEIDSPHGRTSLSILIFQDIIIVPMMLLAPILAGKSDNVTSSVFLLLLKVVGIIFLVWISAKWIVPNLMRQIVKTRLRELFIISIFVICFGVVWITASLGLSLALGAFLAGLIISETEYSHYVMGNIMPFKDVFTSFFFVSIGMLLDSNFLLQNLWIVLLLVFVVVGVKAIIAGFVTLILRYPLRTAILTGLGLCQIGEFSFILSRSGLEYGFLSGSNYQLFLAVSVLTMAATPFLIAVGPKIAFLGKFLPLPKRIKYGSISPKKADELVEDHLIIVGFGLVGNNLAKAAKISGIRYTIIELNSDTVQEEKSKGEHIFYGDASQEAVLQHANIKKARLLVIAINDPTAIQRITQIAKQQNPTLYIIVRTRYLQEVAALHTLGADEVIPEEFETSIEIFSRVLARYLIPLDTINELVSEIRFNNYAMFRSVSKKNLQLRDLQDEIPEIEITTLRIDNSSNWVDNTIAQIDLRKRCGITIVAIKRGNLSIANPSADSQVKGGDQLVLLGKPEQFIEVNKLLNAER